MWLGGPVRLAASVTLELSLLNELPSLRSNGAVVPVGQFPFLCVVDRPPLGADVDATADANPLTSLTSGRLRFRHGIHLRNAICTADGGLPAS